MVKFGNYRILEKIVETKYTEIFRAIHLENNSKVILKALKGDFPSQGLIARLKTEFQILNQLNSSFVVKAYSLEKQGNTYAISLEDIEGISLREFFSGKVELAEFLEIAIFMVNAIEVVHKNGIIHKDINPTNFIYNTKTQKLKIIDFGISTTFSKENSILENPNVLEGTLSYISPEQTGRMNRFIDYRADFYSLGVTFYEFITGKLPFEFSDPMELIHSHLAREAIAPTKLDPSIPIPLSDLIMKLMSKTVEDRYLSCFGLRYDLEMLKSKNPKYTDSFPKLGKKDISDKFQIPQKLYGREKEIEVLITSFNNIGKSDNKIGIDLMFISGYSGIGKSSLVAEIYKPITEKRGLFISGKFDQFQRSVPYSAVVFAFRNLVQQLLTETDSNLQIWREKLLESFNSKGQVVIDVIPEIELIIGKQPPLPELPPIESRNRFNLVFQDFIHVFCAKEHPLVIFLDDLQWADSATLKLIELIATDKDLSYLYFIGSYRDNEINATHPFNLLLENLKKSSLNIHELKLTPLKIEHIIEIVADTLYSDREKILPIAKLIESKTHGNPFFVNEFLKTLYSEKLIQFNISDDDAQNIRSPWKWDIEQIKSIEITENVVELLVGNMRKLPNVSQDILQLASCVGSNFDLHVLSIISELPESQLFEDLKLTIQQGLVIPLSRLTEDLIIIYFKFAHDRIHQAAHSLIDESSKKEFHLKVGRLLLKNTKEIEENVFEIVNQLNEGIDLIIDEEEKITLANLNLIAGLKARHSNAEMIALKHFSIGLNIIPENAWESNYKLCFQLHKEAASVEYSTGNFKRGKYLFSTVLQNAKSNLDKSEIYSIEMNLYMTQGDFKTGTESGLNALRILGLDLPKSEIELADLVMFEAKEVSNGLKDKNVSTLINMPDLIDPEKKAIMQILVDLWALSYLDANYTLLSFTVLHITNISLKEGNSSLSAFGFVTYAMTISGEGRYKEAFELGNLALTLNEKFNNSSLIGKINNLFCHSINPYTRHLKSNIPYYHAAYQACTLCGDLTYGGWALFFIIWTKLEIGDPLQLVSDTADQYLPLVEKNNDLNMTYVFKILQRLIWIFLGKIEEKDNFSDGDITEEDCINLWEVNNFDHGINWFSYSKAHLLYLLDKPEQAFQVLKSVESKVPSNVGFFPVTKYNFFYALSIASIYETKNYDEKKILLNQLIELMNEMEKWSQSAPSNFLHKFKLIQAEYKRISGEYFEAQKLYDDSINLASKYGYIQDEALANELAGKFWLGVEKIEFAKIYFKNAFFCYSQWGAKQKILLLSQKYPDLLNITMGSDLDSFADNTIVSNTTVENTTRIKANISLDFVSILKASQIISGEIILERLVASLMKVLVENAGAQKGILVTEDNNKLFIEAEWNPVTLNTENISKINLLEQNERISSSIVKYVSRTRKSLIIEDVTKEGNFNDYYISRYNPKSVLCIPLLVQSKLVGIVYLENNLTAGAFTSDRIEVLKMLSSQAAISIENARLYSNLENVTTEKTKISTEMEIARDIQTSLLPKNPTLSGFEIATYMHTADLVGGDYFDVIQTDGREWFLIGDVSGHGITAGLIMMMTQTAIHTILDFDNLSDPSILLKKVNKVITSNIHKMNLNKYMTLTLFLKEKDGVIYYSGMHQDLLLYVAKTKNVEIIETKGSWIGYFDLHNEHQVDKIHMESGDVLLLFTDGVTESINSKEEMYDIKGLIHLLSQSGAGSSESIKKNLLESLKEFKTDDDITFMICKKK